MKSTPFHSEKPPGGKLTSSSSTSKTDFARLKKMLDKEIKLTTEHPEADPGHIVGGVVRRGVSKR